MLPDEVRNFFDAEVVDAAEDPVLEEEETLLFRICSKILGTGGLGHSRSAMFCMVTNKRVLISTITHITGCSLPVIITMFAPVKGRMM